MVVTVKTAYLAGQWASAPLELVAGHGFSSTPVCCMPLSAAQLAAVPRP